MTLLLNDINILSSHPTSLSETSFFKQSSWSSLSDKNCRVSCFKLFFSSDVDTIVLFSYLWLKIAESFITISFRRSSVVSSNSWRWRPSWFLSNRTWSFNDSLMRCKCFRWLLQKNWPDKLYHLQYIKNANGFIHKIGFAILRWYSLQTTYLEESFWDNLKSLSCDSKVAIATFPFSSSNVALFDLKIFGTFETYSKFGLLSSLSSSPSTLLTNNLAPDAGPSELTTVCSPPLTSPPQPLDEPPPVCPPAWDP